MTLSSLILADAPIGYWPMTETTGTTFADQSGNGRNLTVAATPVTPAYAAGPCDGSGDSIAHYGYNADAPLTGGWAQTASTAAFRLNGDFTVEFWARVYSWPWSFPGFVAYGTHAGTAGDGWLVYHASNLDPNAFVFRRYQSGVGTYGITVPMEQKPSCLRHHVVRYTASSGTVEMILDAEVLNTNTGITLEDVTATSGLMVGTNQEYPRAGSDFIMGHLAVYDSVLSDARVTARWREGRCSGCYVAARPTVGYIGPGLMA